MDIIGVEGNPYVKLEMVFNDYPYGGVDVYFNVGLMAITSEVPEYPVWDAETKPQVEREPEYETELLSSILDGLLIDRYIDLDQGLLENIGVHSTRIHVGLNSRLDDFTEKYGAVQEEIKALIKKSVTLFMATKV